MRNNQLVVFLWHHALHEICEISYIIVKIVILVVLTCIFTYDLIKFFFLVFILFLLIFNRPMLFYILFMLQLLFSKHLSKYILHASPSFHIWSYIHEISHNISTIVFRLFFTILILFIIFISIFFIILIFISFIFICILIIL